MAGLLRAFLNATNFRTPLLRTVVPTVGAAFAIQAAVAVPSILAQTERFYDLSGSLTYLSCTALSLYLPVLRARAAGGGAGAVAIGWPSILKSLQGKSITQGGFWDWRQLVLSAAVGVWATRLGSYLFSRITSDDGKDSRFENIRSSPPKFFAAFMAQATWVSLVLLPITALNAIPPTTFASISYFTPGTVMGVALWAFGFLFEVTADRQKSQWVKEKKEKKHSEDFLTRGLWSKSRHPNYFGEITLWTGIAVTAASILASSAGQSGLGWSGSPAARLGALLIAGVSPAFTAFLLTRVSGIPLSEEKYDKKYGNRKDYQEWKENTPMLFPKLYLNALLLTEKSECPTRLTTFTVAVRLLTMLSPYQPRTMPTPVPRCNLPSGPPSLPFGPPQAQMSLTYQQQQARQAFLNYEPPRSRAITVNKKAKRPREIYDNDELGTLVPKRMKNRHGKAVQAHTAFDLTPKANASRPIAADLMESIHLGDNGLFLACDAGVRYYIWRYAARLDSPEKAYNDNLFGNIPIFSLPFSQCPSNESVTIGAKAATYAYLYGCWQTAVLGRDCESKGGCTHAGGDCTKQSWTRLFGGLGVSRGLNTTDQLHRSWLRISAYFAEARRIWLSETSNPDNATAYLRASEMFWWDDSVEPLSNERLPGANPTGGVEVFYPREIDRKTGTALGHYLRSNAIWQIPRKTSSNWLPRVRPIRPTSQPPHSAFWQRVFTLYEHQKELKERPPVEADGLEPTLWMAAVHELHDKNSTWRDSSMESFFDFDEGAADGLCEKWRRASPDTDCTNTLNSSISQAGVGVFPDEIAQGQLLEDAGSKLQATQHHCRQDSGAGTQRSSPPLPTDCDNAQDITLQNCEIQNYVTSALDEGKGHS